MNKKSSVTKRTPSPSRAKNTRVKTKPFKWNIMWIRTTGTDEFVAAATKVKGGWLLAEPTIVTNMQGQLVLAPYGLMASDSSVTIKDEHILHANQVTPAMMDLYEASIDGGGKVKDFFEKLIRRAIDQTVSVMGSDDEEEQVPVDSVRKTIAELSEHLDEALGRPKEFGGVKPADTPRTRAQTIDDLAKLADKLGKGKKKRED